MLINDLEIQGLRAADGWSATGLESRVSLPVPPQGVAVADALSVLEGALRPDRFQVVLGLLQLAGPGLEMHYDEAGFAEQATGLDAAAVDALLMPEGSRRITVGARIALDPPLFGRLREESLRDPRVMTALGRAATVYIKVGWLFSMDRTAVSVGVLDMQLADTPFPLIRSERPRWMDGVLQAVGNRLGRVAWADPIEAITRRLLAASLSPDAETRRAFRRISTVLSEAPFDFGALELVRSGDHIHATFGDTLTWARQLGPSAVRGLRLVEAALLRTPDVLVVEDATPEEADWLASCTGGEHATLEQVWLPAQRPS